MTVLQATPEEYNGREKSVSRFFRLKTKNSASLKKVAEFFNLKATKLKTRASCKIDCFFKYVWDNVSDKKSLSVPPRFVRWLRESTDIFLFERRLEKFIRLCFLPFYFCLAL
jgi:hypothetical protein